MRRGALHGPSLFGKDARSIQVAHKSPLRRKGSILVERHFRLPANANQAAVRGASSFSACRGTLSAVSYQLWSAVAAATAFLARALARLRYEAKAEGGSCCYRQGRLRWHEGRPHRTPTRRVRLAAAAPRCATTCCIGCLRVKGGSSRCARPQSPAPFGSVRGARLPSAPARFRLIP